MYALLRFGKHMFALSAQNSKQKSPEYWTIFCRDVCAVYGTESTCYYRTPDLTCPYQKIRRQLMQTKKMKVQYSSRARQSKNHYFGSGYIETPKIQMEGKWLEALGFHIGDAIQVAYEEGSIHISLAPQTQSEPAMVCDTKAGYASK